MSRIFFDMDGTLAQFGNVPETVWRSEGYYLTRPAMKNMAEAFKLLLKTYGADNVYILSAAPSQEAALEKAAWVLIELDDTFPLEHIICVPYGEKKGDYINAPKSSDLLIDDYSPNLREWHGVSIKCRNGINGTHGSWRGNCVYAEDTPKNIVWSILSLCA